VPLRWPRGGRLLALVAALLLLVLLTGGIVTDLYIDVLWFSSVGYLDVFWTRALWSWGLRLLAGGVAAGVVYLNLRFVAETLGTIQVKRQVGDLEIVEKLPRIYVHLGVAGIALLVGFWFGAAVPEGAGLRTLVWLRSSGWGLADPILGHDASFYVFALPLLNGTLLFLMVLTFLAGALSAAGYAATGGVAWGSGRLELERVPRMHLSLVLGAFFLLLAARFWLGRPLLLLDGSSAVEGIVGFADVEARLPAYRAAAIVTLLAAGGLVWGGIRDRATTFLGSLVAVVVGGFVLLQIYPAVVQRFQVEPNELERETPYIEHNIAFTRAGFGLDRLVRRDFDYRGPEGAAWDEGEDQLRGLPVWTRSTLLTTFREIEARFRYYAFASVAFDRYPARGEGGRRVPEVVATSVREIDPSGIEDPNWQNLHVRKRYISGRGAVAVAAAKSTDGGRPRMILSGIPPRRSEDPDVPEDLELTRSEVYFGSQAQLYAILNPGEGIFETEDGEVNEAGVDYPRGIQLDSPLRTLALAWRFRDANLLFSTDVSDASRFVFRRQVVERAATVAPFLRYLEAPYPVIHQGRTVWVLEGFTASRSFPLASAHGAELRRPVNYIRNSVKVTLDALSGELRFWVVDSSDPLLAAYREAFPGLFRSVEEMPPSLRRHIRYPRSLLELQANVLQAYHQETAARFHGRQDLWDRPNQLGDDSRTVPYRAEYGVYRLPGEEAPGFHLTTVFVPRGRQNLTGVLVARNDPERYGELLLLDVPVDEQVSGPRQVEALVEQDPVISQQFSLWRTGGSQVWTGHLHLVPVDGGFLYMEPIFLAADQDAIPELRRYVVSDGRRVVMAPALDDALEALREGEAGIVGPISEGGAAGEEGEEGGGDRAWPDAALEALERAEALLRQGDWAGFGQALDELRSLLEEAESAPATPGGAVP